ncbi:MAG: chemotaxis protein CheB [Desulfarculus sp.]|nr:chemotaxis protein CheB [Desulfarculus sp.]
MRYRLVVMGASLGGLNAMQVLLKSLPKDFALPLAVVQHRDKDFVDTALPALRAHSLLPLREVDDKQAIEPGWVDFAPNDYHLLVDGDHYALSVDELVNLARPAVDVLFISAAEALGPEVVGVILTGTGVDGAQGLQAIAARGGLALVQDPATAEAPGMPSAALACVPQAVVLPLEGIGPFLARLT